MKVPKIVLGAGVMAPALALLPASPAEASTEIDLQDRRRDVTVIDAQGTEHECELSFELSLSTNWDAGGEWGQGGTSSGLYEGDPYCSTATVEVTVIYGSGGTEYRTHGNPFEAVAGQPAVHQSRRRRAGLSRSRHGPAPGLRPPLQQPQGVLPGLPVRFHRDAGGSEVGAALRREGKCRFARGDGATCVRAA